MLKKPKIFLESHNIRNPNSGFGQFNYHLIKAINDLAPTNLEITIHAKATAKLRKDFNNGIKFRNYFQITRYPFFRIRKKYDLWHCMNQNTKIEPASDLPYLLTVHDVNFLEEYSFDMNHERNVRFQAKLDRSIAITYISNYAKASTHQFFKVPEVPEYVIYNGNPINSIELPEDHKPKIITKKPYLFSIGEFTKRKNFHSLVKVLQFLPDHDLILSGKNETEYAKNVLIPTIEELNLENRVHITGKISDIDKHYYLNNCTAFVFPSLREGFGIPPIEAMRFGKPVFLSNNTSLPEIGGEHAFYWDHHDPKYMAQIITEGLRTYNANKEALSQQYIAHAKSFKWSEAAKKYIDVYNTLI